VHTRTRRMRAVEGNAAHGSDRRIWVVSTRSDVVSTRSDVVSTRSDVESTSRSDTRVCRLGAQRDSRLGTRSEHVTCEYLRARWRRG
jgi:hypothetical protein